MHILAGQDGLPAGFAAMELTVPPHFAGPGSLFVAPRGHRVRWGGFGGGAGGMLGVVADGG